jgi:nicotinate-nucleotide pyrophosphorylase (carboxylating)
MPDLPESRALIRAALAEDLGVPVSALDAPDPALLDRDVTSSVVVPEAARLAGRVAARAAGVICGLPLVGEVYATLSAAAAAGEVEITPLVAEGAFVEPGDAVLEVEGPARVVLAGERVALNLLMTLSGIATAASRWQEAAGESLRIVDTRKTLPGLRVLSKYAVRVGGAGNHREGLWDMVLVKDNHIRQAGGITAAVDAAREHAPGLLVQVEADTVEQAEEAARAGADMVLLDNMDDATIAAAVRALREASAETGTECLTEVSGGITLERLGALRTTLVDRVSTSALTLAPPLDLGLDERGRL